MRQRAIDAVDLLNDFIGDLIAGGYVIHNFRKQQNDGRLNMRCLIPIQRMCLCHLILTLNKWCEFYDKYNQLLADAHRDAAKNLCRNIREKKIKEFRDKFIGHIWDNKFQRPLTHFEITSRLQNIVGANLSEFLTWINNPEDNTFPNTVVAIIETVRDSILIRYGITEEEVTSR